MITSIHKFHKTLSCRILSAFTAIAFILTVVLPPTSVSAEVILNLPAPGTMVSPSAAFMPAMINGITIHPENPLEFDFIVGTGDQKLQGKAFEEESTRLIKYFLAALTVPEDQMWVNLSPYEKDRIIPQSFGTTEMGRDLLAQDYILKQLTASLMYPEKELGSSFWKKIYRKAKEQYGTTQIPMNTFNKVWIVPEKAVVYEHGNSAFVVKSRLKVMLEKDYLAGSQGHQDTKSPEGDGVSTEIIREIILPEIEKEVNEGRTFANLRQIYNSVILAAWFKQNLKQTLLGQVYVDKAKTKGVDVEDKAVNQKIYEQYLEAFKKGVYNYIKEDTDPVTKEVIPRKYFSGGTEMTVSDLIETYRNDRPLTREQQEIVGEYLAGLKEYNQGQVRVELAELSEDMPVARAKQLIQENRKSDLSPAASASSIMAAETLYQSYQKEIRAIPVLSQEIAQAFEREILLWVFDRDDTLTGPRKEIAEITTILLELLALFNPAQAMAVLTAGDSDNTKTMVWDRLLDQTKSKTYLAGENGGIISVPLDGNLSQLSIETLRDKLGSEGYERLKDNVDRIKLEFELEDGQIILDRKTMIAIRESDPTRQQDIKKSLIKYLSEEGLSQQLRVETSSIAVDINLMDKGEGLLRLVNEIAKEKRKIVKEILQKTVAVGDSTIDIPMLKVVAEAGGLAVWVGNPSASLPPNVLIIAQGTESLRGEQANQAILKMYVEGQRKKNNKSVSGQSSSPATGLGVEQGGQPGAASSPLGPSKNLVKAEHSFNWPSKTGIFSVSITLNPQTREATFKLTRKNGEKSEEWPPARMLILPSFLSANEVARRIAEALVREPEGNILRTINSVKGQYLGKENVQPLRRIDSRTGTLREILKTLYATLPYLYRRGSREKIQLRIRDFDTNPLMETLETTALNKEGDVRVSLTKLIHGIDLLLGRNLDKRDYQIAINRGPEIADFGSLYIGPSYGRGFSTPVLVERLQTPWGRAVDLLPHSNKVWVETSVLRAKANGIRFPLKRLDSHLRELKKELDDLLRKGRTRGRALNLKKEQAKELRAKISSIEALINKIETQSARFDAAADEQAKLAYPFDKVFNQAVGLLHYEQEIFEFLQVGQKAISAVRFEVERPESEQGGAILKFTFETTAGQKILHARFKHPNRSKDPRSYYVFFKAAEEGIFPPVTVIADTLIYLEKPGGISLQELAAFDKTRVNAFLRKDQGRYFAQEIGKAIGRLNKRLGITVTNLSLGDIILTPDNGVYIMSLFPAEPWIPAEPNSDTDLVRVKSYLKMVIESINTMGRTGRGNVLPVGTQYAEWVEEGYNEINLMHYPPSLFSGSSPVQIEMPEQGDKRIAVSSPVTVADLREKMKEIVRLAREVHEKDDSYFNVNLLFVLEGLINFAEREGDTLTIKKVEDFLWNTKDYINLLRDAQSQFYAENPDGNFRVQVLHPELNTVTTLLRQGGASSPVIAGAKRVFTQARAGLNNHLKLSNALEKKLQASRPEEYKQFREHRAVFTRQPGYMLDTESLKNTLPTKHIPNAINLSRILRDMSEDPEIIEDLAPLIESLEEFLGASHHLLNVIIDRYARFHEGQDMLVLQLLINNNDTYRIIYRYESNSKEPEAPGQIIVEESRENKVLLRKPFAETFISQAVSALAAALTDISSETRHVGGAIVSLQKEFERIEREAETFRSQEEKFSRMYSDDEGKREDHRRAASSPVRNVLLVDDNPDALEIGKEIISSGGRYKVTTAKSPAEAMAILKKQGPSFFSLVVSDFLMPEMDGVDFAKEALKANPGLSFIINSETLKLLNDKLTKEKEAGNKTIEKVKIYAKGERFDRLNPDSLDRLLGDSDGHSQRLASSAVAAPEVPGGIDLNPGLLDLQIKRDGNGVPLPLPQQPIENMRIEGFIPVIINVTPVTNLPMLLGLADTKEEDTDSSVQTLKAREPEKSVL